MLPQPLVGESLRRLFIGTVERAGGSGNGLSAALLGDVVFRCSRDSRISVDPLRQRTDAEVPPLPSVLDRISPPNLVPYGVLDQSADLRQALHEELLEFGNSDENNSIAGLHRNLCSADSHSFDVDDDDGDKKAPFELALDGNAVEALLRTNSGQIPVRLACWSPFNLKDLVLC